MFCFCFVNWLSHWFIVVSCLINLGWLNFLTFKQQNVTLKRSQIQMCTKRSSSLKLSQHTSLLEWHKCYSYLQKMINTFIALNLIPDIHEKRVIPGGTTIWLAWWEKAIKVNVLHFEFLLQVALPTFFLSKNMISLSLACV